MPAITVRIKLHLSSGYKNKCELIEVEKKAISDNGNADMEV